MNNIMTLKDKFGQMILLGLDTYEINDEITRIIRDYKIGGVVLYKKNYTSVEKMISFINKLKKISKNRVPLFIAIDQENGIVNRFPKDVSKMYSAKKLAECENQRLALATNEITAYLLKRVGVNMNFAPVLDVVRSDKNKVIGSRSYGNNKDVVIKNAIPFMQTIQKNNIVSVIKHFPGHGLTNRDSHILLPRIRNPKKLENEDLKVFEKAIENGADAIMLGHLSVKGYGLLPASLNKKMVKELLIDKYNFNGLIITDDLRMASVRKILSLKRRVKKSINANANLIMIKYNKGDYKRFKKVFDIVKNCEVDLGLIISSYKKIVAFKEKYKVTNDLISKDIELDKINERIDKINEAIDQG